MLKLELILKTLFTLTYVPVAFKGKIPGSGFSKKLRK
jgi:hypothetical protein